MRGGIIRWPAAILLLTLFAGACSHPVQQPPQPSTSSARPVKQAQALAVVRPDLETVNDERAIAAAQRALIQLGYSAGKADGIIGAATRRAIIAFQKDHGRADDGRLTLALANMLGGLVAQLPKTNITLAAAGDTVIFDDGSAETVSIEHAVPWDENNSRSLVAIRPSTTGWPPAARAGLDWATTRALEVAGAPPLQWSSTGVSQHFEIYASATLSPREVALAGNTASSCRHFELRGEGPQKHYPGIACRDAKGGWYLPHSPIRLARPATGLGTSR
jgi:peptidoglycan hydrolase-like protein with peptidoglycan-binding domain